MFILDVTPGEIVDAVRIVNAKYGGNIDSQILAAGFGTINLKLHAKDITGPGHRLTHPAIHGGVPMNIATACWHVHYDVFIHLPQRAAIKKDRILYYVRDQMFPVWTVDNGGHPILITELCECSRPKQYVNPVLGQHDWRELYTKVDSSRKDSYRPHVNHQLYNQR
jgi:hypothetical protein